ncbi:hypothetical protein ACFYXF_34640 [Streptomyces sp. NPDC002680]|uniref:hypothetical protein n=1 Tax=Streptomyces sp. NPDC002680 TaxID=3364659 RepID=UPI0036B64C72
MSDLKLFRPDADGWDVELRGSTLALEVKLQRRIEASMEAVLGIRFLASEYPTGPWHKGRIDSLGLDENGTPALIEYKKGADSGVLSQAVSYLSWLDSARHEFEALVKEKLGSEAGLAVGVGDWEQAGGRLRHRFPPRGDSARRRRGQRTAGRHPTAPGFWAAET